MDHVAFAVKNLDSFILRAKLEEALVALRRVPVGVLHVIEVYIHAITVTGGRQI